MKKYKVHWSIFNLFQETQSEVVKLQQLAKTLMGSLTGLTWLASDANHAIYVGFAAMLLDAILGCFYFEKQNPPV